MQDNSIMKGLRGRKKRDGTIVLIYKNRFGLSLHPGGGMSMGMQTEAQMKKNLGKAGGIDIKNGLGRLIIEAMFFPKAVGTDVTKPQILKKFLFL